MILILKSGQRWSKKGSRGIQNRFTTNGTLAGQVDQCHHAIRRQVVFSKILSEVFTFL